MDRPTWPLGLYCERAALGFWGEPLNALSNLAFFVAAFLCWRTLPRGTAQDWPSVWLIALIVMIGFGSGAFHTVPSRTTVLMDVIPIGIFILSSIAFAIRRYLAAPWWLAVATAATFALFSPEISRTVAEWLPRGSAGYLPALLAMPAIAAAMFFRAGRLEARSRSRKDIAWAGGVADPSFAAKASALRAAAALIMLATAVFAASLTFRTLDQPFCGQNPLGLHFLWHLLNAIVLYLITRAQIGWRPHA
ncbi:MAG: ceramidase domain-containing protein [Beijerinckiaceae bacterium]